MSRPARRVVAGSFAVCSALALCGCGGDGGTPATVDQPQPFVGPQPGPPPPPPGRPAEAFSPQEAVALLLAIQKGEKRVEDLTDRDRMILAALVQATRERRERRGG